jgi:hypothetical protein
MGRHVVKTNLIDNLFERKRLEGAGAQSEKHADYLLLEPFGNFSAAISASATAPGRYSFFFPFVSNSDFPGALDVRAAPATLGMRRPGA